jgi:hypothetical protein
MQVVKIKLWLVKWCFGGHKEMGLFKKFRSLAFFSHHQIYIFDIQNQTKKNNNLLLFPQYNKALREILNNGSIYSLATITENDIQQELLMFEDWGTILLN